uniref:(northern house mosquito) hypothetical protein n=1 Tax=Culex pipiens TaxID=7175 RepID=A0A8D8J779_CULPI
MFTFSRVTPNHKTPTSKCCRKIWKTWNLNRSSKENPVRPTAWKIRRKIRTATRSQRFHRRMMRKFTGQSRNRRRTNWPANGKRRKRNTLELIRRKLGTVQTLRVSPIC